MIPWYESIWPDHEFSYTSSQNDLTIWILLPKAWMMKPEPCIASQVSTVYQLCIYISTMYIVRVGRWGDFFFVDFPLGPSQPRLWGKGHSWPVWFYATKVGGGVGSTLGTSRFVETLCGPLWVDVVVGLFGWDVLERCGTIKSLEVTNWNRWIISNLFVICFFF